MKCKLAIVIPAYKGEFLEKTLHSISNQTDNRFNLYIGDDASPDGLEEVVKKFQNALRITYVRFEKNIGAQDLVAQWTRCIDLTEGEPFIWLFSDDDVMAPNCVQAFYDDLARNPEIELYHFNIKMIDELDGGVEKDLPRFPSTLSAGEYLSKKLKGEIFSFVVEFIFSRRLYEKVGGFLKYDLAWGSDFMTWLYMASQQKGGIFTSSEANALVYWRKSMVNISPDKTNQTTYRKIKSLNRNARFIKCLFRTNPGGLHPLSCSFRWLRFPLGEIWRNKRILTFKQIVWLLKDYMVNISHK